VARSRRVPAASAGLSLDPKAKFRFVNVAEWELPQHFQTAMRTEAFQQISRKMAFAASPALYRVIAE
jgi:hypothetical protein